MQNIIIFGGQFGSEGKGAYTEWLINEHHERRVSVVFAEPSPNSGHTCSLGKLRQLPTASFWADHIMLGPDSLINVRLLLDDIVLIRENNPSVKLFIHENAGMVFSHHIDQEVASSLEHRVASTCSGVGEARRDKFINRDLSMVVRCNVDAFEAIPGGVTLLDSRSWLDISSSVLLNDNYFNIFECNQGVMLDTNFGYFPFCTSRSTLPQAALARNGLALYSYQWEPHMIIRTFPIRTGGNSGPTGGHELRWSDIKNEPEIATVTKRVRRVFSFSARDFELAFRLTTPYQLAITHCDYVFHDEKDEPGRVWGWMNTVMGGEMVRELEEEVDIFYSSSPGKFKNL